MNEMIRTKLSDGGRVIIPLELREEFHLQPGDELIFVRDEHGIHILTLDLAIERAQHAVRRLHPRKTSATQELKKMRQAETRKEANDL